MHMDGTPENLTTTQEGGKERTKEDKHREKARERDEKLLDTIIGLQSPWYKMHKQFVIYYYVWIYNSTHNFSVQYDCLLQLFSARAIWTNLATWNTKQPYSIVI